MVEDHRRLHALTDELTPLADALDAGPVSPTEVTALRRVLYGLHALVSIHLLKEEEVYLPILDAALTVDEVEQLYAEMRAAEANPLVQA
jgi:iron-sulfur cluster repair protein YtfE (RIC family)